MQGLSSHKTNDNCTARLFGRSSYENESMIEGRLGWRYKSWERGLTISRGSAPYGLSYFEQVYSAGCNQGTSES
jgi:hypothetical protein